MCLTVRSARSFYEWSQRTGPDDPSETNLPVFHRPPESGHMPAGGQVQMGPGNSVLLKSRAKQAARERSAKPSPALRSSKSNPQCTPRAAAVSSPCCGADLQVRAGSPEPAPVSSSTQSCGADLQVRVGSPEPAPVSSSTQCCRADLQVRVGSPGPARAACAPRASRRSSPGPTSHELNAAPCEHLQARPEHLRSASGSFVRNPPPATLQ
jgi:hypothetical protein